jgi:hypothetical protein
MPVPSTPAERSHLARLGGLAAAAKNDTVATTQKARSTFAEQLLAKLIDEVDPHRSLTEKERARRVEAARKLYYSRLAYRSHKARRANAARRRAERGDVA